jgi:hypothetical protein
MCFFGRGSPRGSCHSRLAKRRREDHRGDSSRHRRKVYHHKLVFLRQGSNGPKSPSRGATANRNSEPAEPATDVAPAKGKSNKSISYGFMSALFLEECLAVLTRTPATLDAMLRGLPEQWTAATEGPGAWSPYTVIGHLIHGEKTDWMPRVMVILAHDADRPFEPFDREAQFRDSQGKPISALLDEFTKRRHDNLVWLRTLDLQPAQLELVGTHPALGRVTLRQLEATWTAHDLAHILQVNRVMAKRYKEEVGPWAEYLSVMR